MGRFNEERALRQKLGRKITDLQGNIRVLCRVRPMNEAEKADRSAAAEGGASAVDILDSERLLLQGASHTFDGVFGPNSTQEGVFTDVQPTVVSALEGFNVCVFAYGQTGSGKTFTMDGPPDNRGVNYRALQELFSYAETSNNTDYSFTLSMLEVGSLVRWLVGYLLSYLVSREKGGGWIAFRSID